MTETVPAVEEGAQAPSNIQERKAWLTPIKSLEEVVASDVRWLIEGLKSYHTGMEPKHVFFDAAMGNVQLWRIEGNAEGLGITKLLKHPGGVELYVNLVVGKKVLPHLSELYVDLEAFANSQGCRWIGAKALGRRLASAYRRSAGFEERGIFLLKEL